MPDALEGMDDSLMPDSRMIASHLERTVRSQ